jgi:hypothetical protein
VIHFVEHAPGHGVGWPWSTIDRESWIDNSTDPVTVWYVDHEGWIVRIQPLD